MKQTMLLKLAPTLEQAHALHETMVRFNEAATSVASVAFAQRSANKFALQKLVYGELRATYRLPAQLTIRAISKACEAYKRDKRICPTFRPEGAIVYDERVMSFKGLTHVSLLTLAGRVLVPFRIGAYQAARMDRIKGQADLLYRHGIWFLAVTLDVAAPTPDKATDTLGVDLGIVHLATDSTGEVFSGEAVEGHRARAHALRGRLQHRTQNGKRTEVVNMMIAELLKEGDKDLLAIATLVGGLAFTKEHEREAFKRRFHVFQEIIRDSWVYQELEHKFRELGLEEGREEERKKTLHLLRQMLTNIVAIHYPELVAFAKEQAERITDPDALQQLTIQIIAAKGAVEVKELLQQVNAGETKH